MTVAPIVLLSLAALDLAPAPDSPHPIGAGIGRPVLADLDRDGVLDVVVGHDAPDGGGRVAVLIGRGDGGFHRLPDETHLPLGHVKVAVADVDGDGRLDAVAGSHDAYEVRVLLGDGKGGLRGSGAPVAVREGTRPHTHAVALADVDGDELPDLLAVNADDGDVSVLLGDGRGGFAHSPGSPFAAGNHPYESLVVRDVDGDGRADVVVPALRGSVVSVLRGLGGGRFEHAPGSPHPVARRPGSVGVGDLDGDGRLDVLATHDADALLTVLRGDEDGLVEAADSPRTLTARAWDVRAADLDGDGRDELVLGGVGSDVFVRFPRDGRELRVRDVGRGPGYVALGDLDGDGLLDVVTGNFSGGDLSVLLARRR